jgi:hypothetical protein
MTYATLDDWIQHAVLPFSLDAPETLNAAVDRLVTSQVTRSGSRKNTSYFPLTSASFSDFDWLAVLDSTTYSRTPGRVSA